MTATSRLPFTLENAGPLFTSVTAPQPMIPQRTTSMCADDVQRSDDPPQSVIDSTESRSSSPNGKSGARSRWNRSLPSSRARRSRPRTFPPDHRSTRPRCRPCRRWRPCPSGFCILWWNRSVEEEGRPLLRPTGSTKECKSRWGKDAIYDMVGNEDEWIDDPEGTFVGGFFSRGTKEGCDSIVTVHPISHWDYSIGFRCCR